jgi:biofilm PGA synthesis N-glycosyltransferase PgaC
MKWVFWISLGLMAYTYLGYPVWAFARSRWRARPVKRASGASCWPSVSIVMAVHNEGEVLPRKLRNLVELDYPSDRSEVIIVSDGASDSTNQILETRAPAGVRVFVLPERQGKAVALNRGIQEARGEIVVFTDARQRLEPDAVSRLVADFADPAVGCVSGELMLGQPKTTAAQGLGLYWRIEKKIRQWEGAAGSVIGATGAVYAARRDLLVPLPADCLLDDVYLPMHVARQGRRVIFEPRARAWDSASDALGAEFRRKVRTLTGNYQLLRHAPWLLTRENPVRFEFVSHKLLRLLVPFALAGVLAASLLLRGRPYQLALVLQFLFYGLAALALWKPKLGIAARLGNMALTFVMLNTAAAVALVYFASRKKRVWVR